MSKKVFISYSRTDEPFVRRLSTSLQAISIPTWVDVKDIPRGANWSMAIQNGLDQSALMLLVLSPSSMSSQNVANEWQYYMDEKKPILPILYQPPTKTHFQLRRLQYIDFHTRSYDEGFRELHLELMRRQFPAKPPHVPENTRQVPPPTRTPSATPAGKSNQEMARLVEQYLSKLGVNPVQARFEMESPNTYGWNFQRGSAIIEVYLSSYVAEDGSRELFQVLSPIAHLPPQNTDKLYRRLLELNLSLTGAALGVYLDVIYLFVEVENEYLTPSYLERTIKRIATYADDMDDSLVREFGGRLYSQKQ